MSISADSLVGGPDRAEQLSLIRVKVIKGASLRVDPIHVVQVGGSSDQRYAIPATNWTPSWDAAYPQTGVTGVVAFDHYRDAWLIAWDQIG